MPTPPPAPLNDPKTIRHWAFFDWANSAYALVITVAIFPAYYAGMSDEPVRLLGSDFELSAVYAYAISIAYLIITVLSPILSGVADYSGRKLFFMRLFTTVGALACLSLWFFTGVDRLALGTLAFMLATIGFAGALVFYNAFLPTIVTPDRYDQVSAKGFSYGYVGSVLLLIVNLLIITFHESLGLSESVAARIAFVSVGLWWLGFAQYAYSGLPPDERKRNVSGLLGKGFAELKKVWGAVQNQPNTKGFLLAFFAYSAGVQTILFLAATFAEEEFGFETAQLIVIILILQVLAIGGAYLFAAVSERRGNKVALLLMLATWAAVCVAGYFIYLQWHFYALAGVIGLVMGGIQSLSRSTYSKLLPPGTVDTTSYFSFYDILEKTAIVSGTFLFGLVNTLTGSMRGSVLILTVFFLLGMALLSRIRIAPANSKGKHTAMGS